MGTFVKMQQEIMSKEALKEAMHLAPELAAKLIHKMDKFGDLSHEITSCEKLREDVDPELRRLRAQIGREAMNVLGAMSAVFKEYYNEPLFREFVDYKNIQKLEGERRKKTLSQMAAILNVADICCREYWGDYLIEEGDQYMIK